MKDRLGDTVPATPEEHALLASVKALFDSKDAYGPGAEFRVAFIDAVMQNYCNACGNRGPRCFCTRED